MSTQCLAFNGINGTTGDYLLPSMTPQDISAIARGQSRNEEHFRNSTAP